jgi:hypothetical protein
MVRLMAETVLVFIKAAGWEGYTGPLGTYLFKDGKSTGKIPVRAALRIGSSIECYDEHDRRLHPSTYVIHESPSSIEATSVTYPVGDVPEAPIYTPVTKSVEKAAEIDTTPTREMVGGQLRDIYTRAQLEAIADKKGIDGLRSIGEAKGVKGKSVVELIDKILGAEA